MLKSYEEMRKIDVKKHCKKRDGLDYLPWAVCVQLLHDNGANVVRWEPVPDEKTGSSLRMSEQTFTDKNGNTNRCYETRIRVTIDENVYEMQTPVMNGANPVKDNSMNQLRVWNSMCRAFVKCVAINTGLGFDLWVKEEGKGDPVIPETLEKVIDPLASCAFAHTPVSVSPMIQFPVSGSISGVNPSHPFGIPNFPAVNGYKALFRQQQPAPALFL